MARLTPFAAVFPLLTIAGLALAQAQDPAPPAGEESPEALAQAIDDGLPVAAPEGGVAAEAIDPAAQATLDRVLPEVTFDGVGLSDVFDFLRDVTNANVFVNWRALEAAGIDRNAPVNARLKNVKFSKALQVMLDSVAGKKGLLAFEVHDGVITISTADDLAANTHTRVYDVRDLIAADRARRLPSLTKLITGSVAPSTWRGEAGGNIGAVRELQGQLIITQTPENHDAILNLLKRTRELLAPPPPAEEPAPAAPAEPKDGPKR